MAGEWGRGGWVENLGLGSSPAPPYRGPGLLKCPLGGGRRVTMTTVEAIPSREWGFPAKPAAQEPESRAGGAAAGPCGHGLRWE